jgi:hypothetical protein
MKKKRGVDDAKRLRIIEKHLSGSSKFELPPESWT